MTHSSDAVKEILLKSSYNRWLVGDREQDWNSHVVNVEKALAETGFYFIFMFLALQ